MPDPTSFLQWLHQTYASQWKGTVDITTVQAPDHAPKNSHWVSTITAAGAVLKSKRDGKNHTLQPITATGDARTKKGAEHAAAEAVYRQLVAEGWWDPEGPPRPKKAAGPSRAHRFLTDSTPCNEANPLAYLDVSIAGQPAGRVVFELFRYKKGSTLDLHAPMAVSNFLAFCKGVDVGGRHLSYVGVPFTRVVKRFVVQAGDVANRDGTGGAHIHSSFGEHFPDEGLDDKSYRHTFPFMLSAANLGLEDTNSSQFFITVAPAASLDGYHTCFGKVLRGYSTVKEIEHVNMLHTASGRAEAPGSSLSEGPPPPPPVPIIITGAGELPAGTVLDDSNAPVLSGGGFPMWAEDQGPPPEGVREVAFRLDIASQLRLQGNEAYKQGDVRTAMRRYRQAYYYLSWTTFKDRLPDGDVDLTYEEQDAIWQAEGVLLCNLVAAQIKLGQFSAAVQETCPDLLRKAPDNPKSYLRAAQARLGLGAGEFDNAVSLLNQGLDKAREQKAGVLTREIVAELHRVRDLRRQHASKMRPVFTAAFKAGLLHHPSDDQPPPQATAAATGRTWRGLPVAGGPVGPAHVLEGDASKPVMVQDAWGTHLLVDDVQGGGAGGAFDSDSEGEGEGANNGSSQRQQRVRRPRQQRLTDFLLRQARLQGGYGPSPAAAAAAAADAGGGDEWDEEQEGAVEAGDGGYDEGGGSAEEGEDEGGSWGAGGIPGAGAGAAVDYAEEAGAWWRDDDDSSSSSEDGEGGPPPQQQQQQQHQQEGNAARADLAPVGDSSSQAQQQQQERAAVPVVVNGSNSRIDADISNGHHEAAAAHASSAAEPPQKQKQPVPQPAGSTQTAAAAAAAAAAEGNQGKGGTGSGSEPAATTADGGGALQQQQQQQQEDDDEDAVGVPEAVDSAAQVAAVVSDSSGVRKGGYGWKADTMPQWSRG